MKQALHTDKAPAAIGPYSQAIRTGDLLFISGQIPVDPATGAIPQGIEAQAAQSLTNIQNILAQAGLAMDSVVKTTVFVQDLKDFGTVNEVYAELFGEMVPARSCVQIAALPKGALVEIECIAAR